MSIAAVYVRWPADETEHFSRFTQSYEKFSPGIEHHLVIVNGMEDYDIGAYLRVANNFDSTCDYLCCLNTYSEILADGWLFKLAQWKEKQLVGATGSWERMDYENWPAFPNPHIRTTGFLISRALLLHVNLKTPTSKDACYAIESGPDSLTRRCMAYGVDPRVVGKDAVGYRMMHWNRTWTYRYGEQDNLLIGDQKTREYQEASIEDRQRLTNLSWGEDVH